MSHEIELTTVLIGIVLASIGILLGVKAVKYFLAGEVQIRPWWHLHLFTWALVLALSILCIKSQFDLNSVPGSSWSSGALPGEGVGWEMGGRYTRGWPGSYEGGTLNSGWDHRNWDGQTPLEFKRVSEREYFAPSVIVFNALWVIVVVLLPSATVCQICLRKWPRFQFSLWMLLVVTGIVSVVLACIR